MFRRIFLLHMMLLSACGYFEHELVGNQYCNSSLHGWWGFTREQLVLMGEDPDEVELAPRVLITDRHSEECGSVTIGLYYPEDDEMQFTWVGKLVEIDGRIFANLTVPEESGEVKRYLNFDFYEIELTGEESLRFSMVDGHGLAALIDQEVLRGGYGFYLLEAEIRIVDDGITLANVIGTYPDLFTDWITLTRRQ